MAANIQTSTVSLTLPISCQICLEKVKQPVICSNHHVFCSSCMEMWLKKASQCPSCRVPITAENPCRKIIGGTNESDHSDSPSMRKSLRKTRWELLLREYEEEIEGLSRENEELKTKNQSLESQLKTALGPCSIEAVGDSIDDRSMDPQVLEEWTNKLRAATDVCDKVKQDMDKLKEANKTLRSQNVDLVQENMRLKAEVVNRSPQKFGRYTVAALEAKIQQYDRDMDHLKRALERSDQYIEDLESRLRKSEKRSPDMQEACGGIKAGSEAFTQQQKINMMLRSLSDNERELICSNPEVENQTFSRNHSFACLLPADRKEPNKGDLGGASSDFLPTTPSTAFRSLTLRSPGIQEKKVAFKPASYLRKLDFEDFPSPGKSSRDLENQFSSNDKFPKGLPPNTDLQRSNCAFWGGWQSSKSNDQPCASTSKDSSAKGATSSELIDKESNSLQLSMENSMDSAYLEKISELDTMLLDGESCSSQDSQFSMSSIPHADLDRTLIPETKTCQDEKPSTQCDQKKQDAAPLQNSSLNDQEAPKGFSKVSESICSGLSHTDELSFDLLFDSLDENKAGSLNPSGQDRDHTDPSSLSSSSSCSSKPVNTTRDRHTLNISQLTKRKSHSPFNTSSPTKISKLM